MKIPVRPHIAIPRTLQFINKPEMKENKSSGNLRNKPRGQPSSATATKTMESTTKVGRRGGAGGKTSSTTTKKTETKTTTTRGGETKSSTRIII